MCMAPNDNKDRTLEASEHWIDVSRRFRDVLKIFFAVAITDVFRSCLMLFAVITKTSPLGVLYQVLILNDVLGFGAIFVLHSFRFQLSGKICAGDYKDDVTNYPYTGQLLESQGAFLIGLVCWVWIGGILLCTISSCIALCSHEWIKSEFKTKIINGWKSVSLIHRLSLNNQNDLLFYQYFFRAV